MAEKIASPPTIKTQPPKYEPPKKVGDAISDAYTAAINAEAATTNRYNNDVAAWNSDEEDYSESIALWNQRKNAMSQSDFDYCFAALTLAYAAIINGSGALSSAHGHLLAGGNEILAGLNAVQNEKLGHYQNALTNFASADTECQQAESMHMAFGLQIGIANAILENYG